jgi:hypothetical protein
MAGNGAGAAALGLAALGGVVAAGALVAGLARLLAGPGRDLVAQTSRPVDDKADVEALAVVRARQCTEERRVLTDLATAGSLTPPDAIKVATLASLQVAPFMVEETAVRLPLESLVQARTVPDAAAARERLLRAIGESHQRVFVQTLTLACANAVMAAGFEAIECVERPHAVQIVGTNPSGRAMVAEVDSDSAGETRIEAEVIGAAPDCDKVLDRFDAALEQAGVKSERPTRKPTGGVCELTSAREFLQKKLRPAGQTTHVERQPANGRRGRRRTNAEVSRQKQR